MTSTTLKCLLLALLLITTGCYHPTTHQPDRLIVAFYNVENLFDTHDDPTTRDNDFTPSGAKHWDLAKLSTKIEHIAEVIHTLSLEAGENTGIIMGLAEVENSHVLDLIVNHKTLKHLRLKYSHFDSSDRRGVDVALIYSSAVFFPLFERAIENHTRPQKKKRTNTRDILWVKGYIGSNDSEVNIFVNHWPSRLGGKSKSEALRIASAKNLRLLIDRASQENEDAAFIVMGDFNDNPQDKSLKLLTQSRMPLPLTNLFADSLKHKSRGTNFYRGSWFLFDQLLTSQNVITSGAYSYQLIRCGIYSPPHMLISSSSRKRSGGPFRTYQGKKYLGGYSDHLPVYLILDLKKQLAH